MLNGLQGLSIKHKERLKRRGVIKTDLLLRSGDMCGLNLLSVFYFIYCLFCVLNNLVSGVKKQKVGMRKAELV